MFVFSSPTCPALGGTFAATLTTPALDRRSLRWFGISACTATPEGQTSITGTARFVLASFYIVITHLSGHTRGTFIPIGGMNQDRCTPHAAMWASITTARWSAWPTASSPWSALTQKLRGRPDAAPDSAALAACASLLGRPLSHLPPTREPQAVGSVSSEGVTKYY